MLAACHDKEEREKEKGKKKSPIILKGFLRGLMRMEMDSQVGWKESMDPPLCVTFAKNINSLGILGCHLMRFRCQMASQVRLIYLFIYFIYFFFSCTNTFFILFLDICTQYNLRRNTRRSCLKISYLFLVMYVLIFNVFLYREINENKWKMETMMNRNVKGISIHRYFHLWRRKKKIVKMDSNL